MMERTPLERVMFAAWLGVDPENIPPQYKGHLCPDTMARWKRVGEAAVAFALASVDTRPKDEDATKIAASLASGAVPNEDSADAHNQSGDL